MMHFSIPPVDFSLAQALQEKIDNKTKPVGSLGRLEEIAVRIGCIQHTLSPQLRDPHMLIFAGDHGAAHAGISAYPQDVSWQMLENYLKGGAAANVFSRLNGMTMLAIDAGVAHDFGPREGLIDAKIDPAGTRNYLEEPAMTRAQCLAAIAKGAEIARAVADRGCNIMGVGEKGIGNTGSASLITHLLTGASLDDCVGRGTGLDDTALAHKKALMKQAIQRAGLPADADVTVARAAMLPTVRLTASYGVGSDRVRDVLDNPIYNLAAGLVAPIFNNGRLAAGRDLSLARREELLADYRASIISSLGDVENALNALQGSAKQQEAHQEVLVHGREAVRLAESRYRSGSDTMQALLDTQRTLFQAQDLAVQLRLENLLATIDLYKALGGGWRPKRMASSK